MGFVWRDSYDQISSGDSVLSTVLWQPTAGWRILKEVSSKMVAAILDQTAYCNAETASLSRHATFRALRNLYRLTKAKRLKAANDRQTKGVKDALCRLLGAGLGLMQEHKDDLPNALADDAKQQKIHTGFRYGRARDTP